MFSQLLIVSLTEKAILCVKISYNLKVLSASRWNIVKKKRQHRFTQKFVIIRPLLDHGLKRGTPQALKGLPLFSLSSMSVCMSVTTLQVTIFDPGT